MFGESAGTYLRTDDFRLAAIRTYLRLGFEPLSEDPEMDRRWENVLNVLRARA